eukprot:4236858-Alexandrium_andersonii.AAC.1
MTRADRRTAREGMSGPPGPRPAPARDLCTKEHKAARLASGVRAERALLACGCDAQGECSMQH